VVGRILVTGGAGFVGSHVVDELVGLGAEVVILDLLHAAAHGTAPSYLNPQAEYAFGDIRDVDLVERCLNGVDAVCHQASMVGLGTDFGDATDYVSHNDLGTAALLVAMHRAEFGGRLVLASSMVVYGEGAYRCEAHGAVRPLPRDGAALASKRFEPGCPVCRRPLAPEAVREAAPLDPRNVYAATKVHQEHLCSAFARETGVVVTALRYHNVYGPRMPRETSYAGVASIFRSALEAERAPHVYEDGRQLRDFVHVRDVARANVLALMADPPVTGTFNIASGTSRTVLQMAETLAGAFGPAAPRAIVTGEYRLGDVRHVFASSTLARERLGFEARVAFEDGIPELARTPLREAALARVG
jgi:dTDP-L-rhamnose 4-epimerase